MVCKDQRISGTSSLSGCVSSAQPEPKTPSLRFKCSLEWKQEKQLFGDVSVCGNMEENLDEYKT